MTPRSVAALLTMLWVMALPLPAAAAATGELEPTTVAGRAKLKVPQRKSAGGTGQPYSNQTRQQLEKSKKSYEDLIQEHEQKLADYRKDPFAHDHKGLLRKAPPDIQKKIIEGRIKDLERQLEKQRNELKKVEEALNNLSGGN